MCRLLVSARLSASSAPDGALLVYDITDEASFTRVKDWVKELRKMLSDELCIAIAGNKCDMEKSRFASTHCSAVLRLASPRHAPPPRHVDKDEVLLYCASVGATHHLTSAKTGAGVSEAFTELMRSEAWLPALPSPRRALLPSPFAPPPLPAPFRLRSREQEEASAPSWRRRIALRRRCPCRGGRGGSRPAEARDCRRRTGEEGQEGGVLLISLAAVSWRR